MLGDQFWLVPALLVAVGVLLGETAVRAEQITLSGDFAALKGWLYRGGEAGARALLGAIASSTIGVAGTTFSITVAALSLASGQMGPRLLRNFVRDRGNQTALGIFLGTFAYALVLLRTVRTVSESEFVPHLGVTGALALALLCVGTLIWFVHHIALSINVETVIEAVYGDLCEAVDLLTLDEPPRAAPAPSGRTTPVRLASGGYLQTVAQDALADWAAKHNAVIRMRARPGQYVPAHVPIADIEPSIEDAAHALSGAVTFGPKQIAVQDLEFSIRQLVEVAVRALSPGVNDPFTAAAVLDRLGGIMCRMAARHLPSGAVARGGHVVLVHSTTSYEGLCDTMFHTIRQNAASSAFVLIRLIEVLARIAEVERFKDRLAVLRRHADLALMSGQAGLDDVAGKEDLEARHRTFVRIESGLA